MNEGDFLSNGDVQAFLAWATELTRGELEIDEAALVGRAYKRVASIAVRQAMRALPPILVDLDISPSRFVPGGLKAQAPLCALPLLYCWKAPDVASGDFQATAAHLAGMSAHLKQAVAARDPRGTLRACEQVLRWGGERNMRHGARPYLAAMGGALPGYLAHCAAELNLRTARLDPNRALGGFGAMNSMLSKIHSLLSQDGLPIYDSRVAGAAATIIEIWRACTGRTQAPLPSVLRFPAIPPLTQRRVTARFEWAADPGQLVYGATTSPAAWAGAAVRLGWLLRALLNRSGGKSSPDAMRAMEAALFMAGYNCRGIGFNLPVAAPARRVA